mgnify:CR=1 FL=1
MKNGKNYRVLSLYTRLQDGEVINKYTEACNNGVSDRSIQRDIDEIRAFCADYATESGRHGYKEIVFDGRRGGYVMVGPDCKGSIAV